ncbi:hypothetical protein GCM10022215_05870 [Nocardioides fonticola]|uniref:Uncharacterized protein n=1 Tax=Nocardioides fonticola TaxID=450363 RepID=A0ABP7XCA6_9ACTN
MQPPSAGMRSPPRQSWVVVANNAGFTMGTARDQAHPRLCCNRRTTLTPRRVLVGDPRIGPSRWCDTRRPGGAG